MSFLLCNRHTTRNWEWERHIYKNPHNILKAEQAFKDVIKCAMNRQFKMKSAFLPSLNGWTKKKDRFCLNGLKNINCWAVIDVLVCIRMYTCILRTCACVYGCCFSLQFKFAHSSLWKKWYVFKWNFSSWMLLFLCVLIILVDIFYLNSSIENTC